jgi:hypothetical protein
MPHGYRRKIERRKEGNKRGVAKYHLRQKAEIDNNRPPKMMRFIGELNHFSVIKPGNIRTIK